MCHTINAIIVFITFLIGRLVFQIGILFGYGYPKLITDFQEESLPWYKVSLLIMMFLALTISALVNIFWMWLIVNQIIRIINRQGDDVEGDVSQSAQSEDRGSEPSI